MDYVLLMAGTITHAQRMGAILENRGIRSFIARAPEGTDAHGCGYGVRLPENKKDEALEILRHAGIGVRGVYKKIRDRWEEVT